MLLRQHSHKAHLCIHQDFYCFLNSPGLLHQAWLPANHCLRSKACISFHHNFPAMVIPENSYNSIHWPFPHHAAIRYSRGNHGISLLMPLLKSETFCYPWQAAPEYGWIHLKFWSDPFLPHICECPLYSLQSAVSVLPVSPQMFPFRQIPAQQPAFRPEYSSLKRVHCTPPSLLH